MKKITVVMGMILAMYAIMVFPSYGQVINGCYQKNNGQLRILTDPGDACRPSERTIHLVSQETLDAICNLSIRSGIPPLLCPSFCVCSKIVFVSSATYTGNLGGLAGADAKCQELAYAAGLGGTFKAWLSDTEHGPNDRFVHSSNPYALVDGTPIASNWTDLTDGTIANPIDKDENGNVVSWWPPVWTNTNPDATPILTTQLFAPAYTCYNWTYGWGGATGFIGWPTHIDSSWTGFWGSNSMDCMSPAHLYCFQQ